MLKEVDEQYEHQMFWMTTKKYIYTVERLGSIRGAKLGWNGTLKEGMSSQELKILIN